MSVSVGGGVGGAMVGVFCFVFMVCLFQFIFFPLLPRKRVWEVIDVRMDSFSHSFCLIFYPLR